MFISENYYYNSEVYAEKIYAFTDRPLYQPGDQVSVKVIARKFINSSKSSWLSPQTLQARIIDATDQVLYHHAITIGAQQAGSDFSFHIPSYAVSGGYTILINDKIRTYKSQFRVAKYVKPHYNVDILFSKKTFKIGEAVSGEFKLRYANGEAVRDAHIDLVVRKQKMNIIEGDQDAESLFPVTVQENSLQTDNSGKVAFSLPAVTTPSRYILSVSAKDQASYQVKQTKELLIASETPTYRLISDKLFSAEGESVQFKVQEKVALAAEAATAASLRWKRIRLEDQSEQVGDITENAFTLQFDQAGTYKILILNEVGDILGGQSHVVQGGQLQTMSGTIQIDLDQPEYDLNDKVKALISFAEPVDHALLTLERDKVEHAALTGETADWVKMIRLNDHQWQAEITVNKLFAPNITFSVLYVKNGQFVFANKGIKVKIPQIEVRYALDKLDYAAGETVKLGIQTSYLGKPIAAHVTVGVVDEMIYVLQPEIAPDIVDFFYHRRRNQVKTSSSMDFHTYDASVSATARYDYSHGHRNRSLKMRERMRREEVETAFWQPDIQTNAQGEAEIEFTMPDAMTRWRITGRAISEQGYVGQAKTEIQSVQSLFMKWGGLKHFRKGDRSQAQLMIFNMEAQAVAADLSIHFADQQTDQSLQLEPGINFTQLAIKAEQSHDIEMQLMATGYQDQLAQQIEVQPVPWKSVHAQPVELTTGDNQITLPKGGFNFKLVDMGALDQRFMQAAKDLISSPYGSVEQTASRLIPLCIAYDILQQSSKQDDKRSAALSTIKQQIIEGRDRLVMLSHPGGFFGWYNNIPNDSYMTAYAYLADFYAAKILGIEHDRAHWRKITDAYRDYPSHNSLKNAVILWAAAYVGQPVQSMLSQQVRVIDAALTKDESLADDNAGASDNAEAKKTADQGGEGSSHIMSDLDTQVNQQLAAIILKIASQELKAHSHPVAKAGQAKLDQLVTQAVTALGQAHMPLVQAALLAARAPKLSAVTIHQQASDILQQTSNSYPTADRALALIFINESLNKLTHSSSPVQLSGPLTAIEGGYGVRSWQLPLQDQVTLKLQQAQGQPPAHFRLYYDSYQTDSHQVPVHIQRNFYLLEKQENKYVAKAVPLSEVNSGQKYIDELVITPEEGQYRYGMLEVPLPPGADILADWRGQSMVLIDDQGQEKTIAIHEIPQRGDLDYHLPILKLDNQLRFHHVVTFSAQGQYHLPQSRFFEMYQPSKKAYREKNVPAIWTLDVH